MLVLRKSRQEFERVALGGESFIKVRPATQADVDEVDARMKRDVAALIAGSEAAEQLYPIVGDEFDAERLRDGPFIVAVSYKLSCVYLVLKCQDGWEGIELEDGTPLPKPEPWSVAMLLADPTSNDRVMKVVNRRLHMETQEGNGLAASLIGEAAIPAGAPTAARAASPANTG